MRYYVHGGIRHLENKIFGSISRWIVHGGIRHLETERVALSIISQGSWRHTPFRKKQVSTSLMG
ncbi:hypothetical protein J518_1293 [Acinetobacter baumannii 1419130]|nr:hypothetical protein J518_1293 [Acinetobacter baumannii 1419130]